MEVVAFVANTRRSLALQTMIGPSKWEFGDLRLNSSLYSYTGLGKVEGNKDPIASSVIKDMKSGLRNRDNNYCLDLSGKEIIGTRIILHKEKNDPDFRISFHHPEKDMATTLFIDAMSRLQALRINHRMGEPATIKEKVSFYLAMHSFYNAMPFFRGSASIGNIFFAGFYASLFGEPLKFEDGIDRWAMVLDYKDFLDRYKVRQDGD